LIAVRVILYKENYIRNVRKKKYQNWLKKKPHTPTYKNNNNMKCLVGTSCFCGGFPIEKNIGFNWPVIMFQGKILKCKCLQITTTDDDENTCIMRSL
jgi:hypothetical protein